MLDINVMPFAKLMGIRIVEASAERVVAELTVTPDLCTAGSILHGGAYMAFADSVGAYATVLNMPKSAMTSTVESKTNFVGAIKDGEVARAEATPVHLGRTTQVWQTRITRPDGKLAALVTQTQMILPPKG